MIDQEMENRPGKFRFSKKKGTKRKLKERFIMPKKCQRKRSVIVKYILSHSGRVESLGEAEVQNDAFEFPQEEIDLKASSLFNWTPLSSMREKPVVQEKSGRNDIEDKIDLVIITDMNKNNKHQVKIKSQLSDELYQS